MEASAARAGERIGVRAEASLWKRVLARVLHPPAAFTGATLGITGLVLAWSTSLWAGALGLELIATGFWCWARAAPDREEQLPRWNWLRRPAAALWLAAASGEVLRSASVVAPAPSPLSSFALTAQAIGVAWAGLELLAALPIARPFAERGGPLLRVGPWLPVMLPSTGFVLLWRHVAHWTAVPWARRAVLLLLVLTAVLATLRAFSRGRWVASLRWLIVADCALAASLVALSVVPSEVTLLLWLGTCGGHAALLAGELRGMAPRRVPATHRLWRLSGWISTACLSWPLLLTLGFGPPGLQSRTVAWLTAAAVGLLTWAIMRRMAVAPERRAVVRRESAVSLSRLTGAFAMLMGPIALALAWWNGFALPWRESILALAPAVATGAIAWWVDHSAKPAAAETPKRGELARGAAARLFHLILTVEHRALRVLGRLGRTVLAASRDLHTGDAQEYLLFLVGLSVLAVLLPLLR
jgi:hypothetical protein